MNAKDAPVEVMESDYVQGKMPKDATKEQWREFHSSFRLRKTTARGLAIEIYRGYSFCPVFNGRRIKPNFSRAWHVALDFDTGDERSSIAHLSSIPLIKDLASFLYTTPSHTDEHPKARVVWIFPEYIPELEFYESLFKSLLWKFPYADQGAKDGLRLYYGSPRCNLMGCWNLLDIPTCNELVTEYEKFKPLKVQVETPIRISPADVAGSFLDRKRMMLLDKITGAGKGKRHTTLLNVSILFGGYVAGGYYAEDDIVTDLRGVAYRLPDFDDDETIDKTIDDGLSIGMSKPLYIERAGNIGDNHGRQ